MALQYGPPLPEGWLHALGNAAITIGEIKHFLQLAEADGRLHGPAFVDLREARLELEPGDLTQVQRVYRQMWERYATGPVAVVAADATTADVIQRLAVLLEDITAVAVFRCPVEAADWLRRPRSEPVGT
ncbi:MAG: hypothetical protein AB7L66_01525 [Gemmatimonadales bacterium]